MTRRELLATALLAVVGAVGVRKATPVPTVNFDMARPGSDTMARVTLARTGSYAWRLMDYSIIPAESVLDPHCLMRRIA